MGWRKEDKREREGKEVIYISHPPNPGQVDRKALRDLSRGEGRRT